MSNRILVTGGAGYLGSVASHALAECGFDVRVLDNLSGGHAHACGELPLIRSCITDTKKLREIFTEFKPDCVVHLAALSNVEACKADRDLATRINGDATRTMLILMQEHGIRHFVFASSAAVYAPSPKPLLETDRLDPPTVYGMTKEDAEHAIGVSAAHSVILRFFNIAGADIERDIGECHNPETHLIPNVIRALMHHQELQVFGSDYPTADGTALRDYVHVLDAAESLCMAVRHLLAGGKSATFNVGSGTARSVTQVIDEASALLGKTPLITQQPRREGDAVSICADISAIKAAWGWKPTHSSLKNIIRTTANWQLQKAAA